MKTELGMWANVIALVVGSAQLGSVVMERTSGRTDRWIDILIDGQRVYMFQYQGLIDISVQN